jgi:short-subunit dehydrogenase
MSKERTVLVTGATAGIGHELSRIFAREGHALVLVSRNGERLAKVADELKSANGAVVTTIPTDLARPNAPAELFARVQREVGPIDILVNNAGIGVYGPFAQMDVHSELEMIQVNLTSLTHLTGLFLPSMIERGFGKILNVASTAAFQPGPEMAVYYASKAYVLNFSEALAHELRGTGVTVTALCPGATATEFQARAKMEKSRLVQSGMMDASTVALAGYRGLMKNKRIVIPGTMNKLLAFSVRLTPRRLVTAIAGYLMKSTH